MEKICFFFFWIFFNHELLFFRCRRKWLIEIRTRACQTWWPRQALNTTRWMSNKKRIKRRRYVCCFVSLSLLLMSASRGLRRLPQPDEVRYETVQKKDKKDKKAGSKKDKKKSALQPGFLSGLGAAGDDDEASSEIEEAFGERQLKEARQRRKDVAQRRPVHGTMNAEMSTVFPCIFDFAAPFLFALPNIKCHSHDDCGSS